MGGGGAPRGSVQGQMRQVRPMWEADTDVPQNAQALGCEVHPRIMRGQSFSSSVLLPVSSKLTDTCTRAPPTQHTHQAVFCREGRIREHR